MLFVLVVRVTEVTFDASRIVLSSFLHVQDLFWIGLWLLLALCPQLIDIFLSSVKWLLFQAGTLLSWNRLRTLLALCPQLIDIFLSSVKWLLFHAGILLSWNRLRTLLSQLLHLLFQSWNLFLRFFQLISQKLLSLLGKFAFFLMVISLPFNSFDLLKHGLLQSTCLVVLARQYTANYLLNLPQTVDHSPKPQNP